MLGTTIERPVGTATELPMLTETPEDFADWLRKQMAEENPIVGFPRDPYRCPLHYFYVSNGRNIVMGLDGAIELPITATMPKNGVKTHAVPDWMVRFQREAVLFLNREYRGISPGQALAILNRQSI